jgi:hypothetical protein
MGMFLVKSASAELRDGPASSIRNRLSPESLSFSSSLSFSIHDYRIPTKKTAVAGDDR